MTHSSDECIVSVLDSPHAVASVLGVVRRALEDGVLDQPQYAEVQVELVALIEAVSAPRE
jgi:hypothetical protein